LYLFPIPSSSPAEILCQCPRPRIPYPAVRVPAGFLLLQIPGGRFWYPATGPVPSLVVMSRPHLRQHILLPRPAEHRAYYPVPYLFYLSAFRLILVRNGGISGSWRPYCACLPALSHNVPAWYRISCPSLQSHTISTCTGRTWCFAPPIVYLLSQTPA